MKQEQDTDKQWCFCDIQNNPARARGYELKPKTEGDNPYRDLDFSGFHKHRN